METLQYITGCTPTLRFFAGLGHALDGGCRWVQYRDKDFPESMLLNFCRQAIRECRLRGVTFIVDDYIELALKVGADGVHLGQNDAPISVARQKLGIHAIIGATANTFEQVEKAYHEGADYIGIGPFRYTSTKKNLAPLLGLDGYRDIIEQMYAHNIKIPIVAIGGITRADIPDIIALGFDQVAVSGAILNAPDPTEETKQIINTIANAKLDYRRS